MLDSHFVSHFGTTVMFHPHMPADQAATVRGGGGLMYVGKNVYRAIVWQTEASKLWAGRNWRRIKRERRRFMKQEIAR